MDSLGDSPSENRAQPRAGDFFITSDGRRLRIERISSGALSSGGSTTVGGYLLLEGQSRIGVQQIPSVEDIEPVPDRPGDWRYKS